MKEKLELLAQAVLRLQVRVKNLEEINKIQATVNNGLFNALKLFTDITKDITNLANTMTKP